MPSRSTDVPPCYAMVAPGLEPVAADEIARDLGGEVKKAEKGIVVFRVPTISSKLLELRTVEDVYLLAWGTDSLTWKAGDLDKIRKWTAKDADWTNLLRLHHSVRPKPSGKPTWHAVTQMVGEHGYRRTDARDAMLDGLAGHIPASWRIVDENAAVEVWLTINGKQAVCGLRLTDETMRHRTYKLEHRPASLRPSVAAAMVRLVGAGPDAVVLDPTCGAGTILAEQMTLSRSRHLDVTIIGGDLEWGAVASAGLNLRRVGPVHLSRWDARRLPLASESVDRIIANPPFGKQLGNPSEIPELYRRIVGECDRVLKPDGRAALLVAEQQWLRPATEAVGWTSQRQLRVRVLGQLATMSVWRKPA
jgi:tRNA (guanine6-N2)-methyltransferase